eukprot:g913.t1
MACACQHFVQRAPDGPIAVLLCFLPVHDAARLALIDHGWCTATASDRPTLWLQLFHAKRLRPPSVHARRASRDLRRAFFVEWLRARPSVDHLIHRAWTAWGPGGRDSPAALRLASNGGRGTGRKGDCDESHCLDVNARSTLVEGYTLLTLAMAFGRLRCAKWLITQWGADVDVADERGFTPLLTAAWRGDQACVAWLLDVAPGLDLDARGVPPQTSSCGGTGPFDAETWARRKGFRRVVTLIERHRLQRRQRQERAQEQAPVCAHEQAQGRSQELAHGGRQRRRQWQGEVQDAQAQADGALDDLSKKRRIDGQLGSKLELLYLHRIIAAGGETHSTSSLDINRHMPYPAKDRAVSTAQSAAGPRYLLWCAFLLNFYSATAAAAAAKGKDVVMIAIDDMRPELGCYGCDFMKTPHMDALAAESKVFDRMYTGIALCAPSRTLFLTSRRADTTRVWTISPDEYWRKSGGRNISSLPQYFKERGFITYGTGKIFHPGGPSNHSDQQYSWSPGCLTCNQSKGIGCDAMYRNTFPEPDGSNIYTSPAVHPYYLKKWNCSDDEMGEGKLAQHAVSLLEDLKAKRDAGDARPFFFAAGFHRPHIPWHAPNHYFDLYDLDLPLAPHQHVPTDVPSIALNNIWVGDNISHGTTGPKAHGYWRSFADIDAVKVSPNFPMDNSTVPAREQRKIRQAYRAAISFTDRNIGVVLSALKRLGFYNDSIIVLWADLGDNDQYGKHTNFEHATRIPFMMKLPTAIWPEFRPGRTSAMVENVDLFPTLAELGAGAPLKMCPADAAQSRATKECTEGLSFAPLLTGASGSRGRMGGAAESLAPSNVWKRASFSQYNRQGEALPNAVMGYSIRVPGWRYTEWVSFNKSRAGYPGGAMWDKLVGAELYEHSNDPVSETAPPRACDWDYEAINLANVAAHSATRETLSRLLHEGWSNSAMSEYKRLSEAHQAAATLDDVYAMEDVFKNVFLRFLRAPELAHLAGTSKRFRRDALADTLWAPLLQNMLEQTHGHAGSNIKKSGGGSHTFSLRPSAGPFAWQYAHAVAKARVRRGAPYACIEFGTTDNGTALHACAPIHSVHILPSSAGPASAGSSSLAPACVSVDEMGRAVLWGWTFNRHAQPPTPLRALDASPSDTGSSGDALREEVRAQWGVQCMRKQLVATHYSPSDPFFKLKLNKMTSSVGFAASAHVEKTNPLSPRLLCAVGDADERDGDSLPFRHRQQQRRQHHRPRGGSEGSVTGTDLEAHTPASALGLRFDGFAKGDKAVR